MAVYTPVSLEQAQLLAHQLNLGTVTALRGIEGGIENTNYFLSTQTQGVPQEHVLTLFERLTAAQVPYYLHLMQHLAAHGVPVPKPAADAQGKISHSVCGKPACVVSKLAGASVLSPNTDHCAQLGKTLANMHLVGQSYGRQQANLRGLSWWNDTAPEVLPHLNSDQARLLSSELAFQNHVAATPAYIALPRGAVHADLFRDNVMFDQERLTGVFDFYFAGTDSLLFDLCVVLNDWCIDLATGQWVQPRAQALLAAYQSERALTAAERQLLSAMLRAAALRFWLSRLWDFHLPREASMLKAHDPRHFERILQSRATQFNLAP